MANSPFLNVSSDDWIASNDLAFAILDGFPVTPGHCLVITKRVVPTWFEATTEEQTALMALVNVVKDKMDETLRPKPDGYNVGFNAGWSAGQTIPHVHIHVIPRVVGDIDDPRGGIRWIIPSKARYW
jgi:diadenosine tetraphosphate (Ap4A) HIT family hydrolase